jgi:hypothetical protein
MWKVLQAPEILPCVDTYAKHRQEESFTSRTTLARMPGRHDDGGRSGWNLTVVQQVIRGDDFKLEEV